MRNIARKKGENLASDLVIPEWLRHPNDSALARMSEQTVDGGRPWAGRPSHGVAHAHDRDHVAARESFLVHAAASLLDDVRPRWSSSTPQRRPSVGRWTAGDVL